MRRWHSVSWSVKWRCWRAGVDEFEVVAGLFLFVLSMEVAVGQAAVPVDGVDVVTVLDEEGKAFEAVGDFAHDGFDGDAADFLEVG